MADLVFSTILLLLVARPSLGTYIYPPDVVYPNGLEIRDMAIPEDCSYRAQTGDYMYQDYTGYLMNGRVFDTSYKRGHPYRFHLGLGKVIKGVDQGMDGMCKGENRTLIFPSELGYRNRTLAEIPARSTLKFEVRLTDIHPSGFEAETFYMPEDCPIKSQKGDFVRQHYNETFTNGTIVDTSYQRHKTYDFKLGVGNVIKGMDMGMMNMCEGERRKITVPAILGYGKKGRAGLIPGGATVIFNVELVEIKPSPDRKTIPTTTRPTTTPTATQTTTTTTETSKTSTSKQHPAAVDELIADPSSESTESQNEKIAYKEKSNSKIKSADKREHNISGFTKNWPAFVVATLVILVIAAVIHKNRGGRSLVSIIRKGFTKSDTENQYQSILS